MPNQPIHPSLPLLRRKSQVLPNALVLDRRLSDAAVRLMVVLNASDTCDSTSDPSKKELCCLLNWTDEALDLAMQECAKFGYIKLTRDDYAFDVQPSFAKGAKQ